MNETGIQRTPNRVPIFFAAMLTVGMGGYLFTWSYFRDGLRDLFPTWTESQLSLPFSVHNIVVIFMVFGASLLVRKMSNRKVVIIGIFALLISLGLFPLLPTDNPDKALVMMVLLFGVLATVSVGIGAIVAFDTYQPWFPERIGLTSGVWTLWGGASPFVLGAITAIYSKHFGILNAIALLGATLAAVLFLTVFFAKKPGPDVKLPVPEEKPGSGSFADCTPGEMLRTSGFWHVFLFNFFVRAAGLIVIDLGGTIASDLGFATLAGLLFAPANGISSVIGGYLMDKIKLSRVFLIYDIILLCGAGMLLFGNSAGAAPLIIVGLVMVGFAYGGTNVGSVAAVRIMFGDTWYAQNLSFVVASAAPASLSVLFCGRAIHAAGGSYTPAYLIIFGIAAVLMIDCVIMLTTKSFQHVSDVKNRPAKHAGTDES